MDEQWASTTFSYFVEPKDTGDITTVATAAD